MPPFIHTARKASFSSPLRAFTLVELLVVIAILAIVISLLSPSLSLAQRSAKSIACLSKLKQLGVAAQLYSVDNDQKLIPMCTGNGSSDAKTWRVITQPYLGDRPDKDIFVCPEDKIGKKSPSPGTQGVVPASYGINDPGNRIAAATYEEGVKAALFDYLNVRKNGKRTSDVVNPPGTIFLSDMGRPDNPGAPFSAWVESSRSTGAANYGYARFPNEAGYSSGGDFWNIYPRHGMTKANVLFFDGHAATVDLVSDIVDHPPGDPKCIYDNK